MLHYYFERFIRVLLSFYMFSYSYKIRNRKLFLKDSLKEFMNNYLSYS